MRTADGIELIRILAQRILQELIEAEATAHIGAEPGEHTETRTTMRNGVRDKVPTTQAGDLDLAIPKVRTGSFFPSLLERLRRIDQALYAVIMEAYARHRTRRPATHHPREQPCESMHQGLTTAPERMLRVARAAAPLGVWLRRA
ncbi:transposase [Streptomyces sp. 11x1]|nr:transposase [Streptomyces sp. 11x1]WNZ14382.1 transposase [Streptomyces sp. 11x1]